MLLRKKYFAQPQSGGLRLDQSHPSASGVVFAFSPMHGPWEISGAKLTNPATITSVTLAPGTAGIGATTSAAANAGYDWGTRRVISGGNDKYSILGLAVWPSTGRHVLFAQGYDAANPYPQIALEAGISSTGFGTDGNVALFEYNNGVNVWASVSGGADDKLHCYVAVRNGAAANSAIYRDGILQTISTAGNNSTVNDSRQQIRVGNQANYSSTDRVFNKPYYLVVVWDRALTPDEGIALSANPWQLFYNPNGRSFVAYAPAGGTTVALTGVSATGSPGSVAPSASLAVSGNAATGSPGSVTAAASLALSGNAATGSPGSVAATLSAALSGNAATTAVGSVADQFSIALSGNAATGAVGTVVYSANTDVTVAASGVAATGSPGTVAPTITVALTGNAATTAVGSVVYTLSPALTGNAASTAVGSLAQSFGINLTGLVGTGAVGTVIPTSSTLYPDPSDVRLGVSYGPGGIYVGTLVVGTGDSYQNIRSFTERH
jgi:hypothetical protein